MSTTNDNSVDQFYAAVWSLFHSAIGTEFPYSYPSLLGSKITKQSVYKSKGYSEHLVVAS